MLRFGFAIVAIALPAFAESALTLENAVHRASAHAERQNTRLAAARASLQYLEAQSRFHWSLRPDLGLFAYSNPALLATNLGLSLFTNKAQAPSAWTWQNARLDLLDAEVSNEQVKLQAEMEAARRFVDALVKQQIRDQIAETLQGRRKEVLAAQESARLGRTTALASVRAEAGALDLEIYLRDAITAHDVALMSLAELAEMNLSDGPEAITLASPEMRGPTSEDIPAAAALVDIALKSRPDLADMREQIRALEHVQGDTRVHLDGASFGFARISGGSGGLLGSDSGRTLLGGNTGSSSLGLSIRLSNTGESKALEALTEARTSVLRRNLDAMENSIREEVRSVRYMAVASQEKLKLARRRTEIAQETWRSVQARAQEGLETADAVAEAQGDALRTEVALRTAASEASLRRYHLRVTCGSDMTETAPQSASALGME